MDEISDHVCTLNDSINTWIESLPETFQAPGYAFILIGAMGLLYLILGLKMYKFVLALIVLSVAGAITYHCTDQNLVITVVVALAAGLVGFLIQYVVVLLLSGAVFAAIAFLGLWIWLKRVDLPIIAGCLAIGLGIFLAVKLFKFVIIFSTAAIGAACVTGSFWVLYRTREFSDTVSLDPQLFEEHEFTVGLIFAGLLVFGILVQSIILALTSKPKKEAE